MHFKVNTFSMKNIFSIEVETKLKNYNLLASPFAAPTKRPILFLFFDIFFK
jgi:hypothetical protein